MPANATQPRQGHYPRQAQIEAYGNGGFRFAGMSHRGSILILPSGIHAWDVIDPAKIGGRSLRPLFRMEEPPELLLLGTGRRRVEASTALRLACTEHGIRIEVMDTGAAVRTYNVLLGEKRPPAAALIAVD